MERALEVAGNDLGSAIKNLNNLHLESTGVELDYAGSNKANAGIEDNVWPSPEGTNQTHSPLVRIIVVYLDPLQSYYLSFLGAFILLSKSVFYFSSPSDDQNFCQLSI